MQKHPNRNRRIGYSHTPPLILCEGLFYFNTMVFLRKKTNKLRRHNKKSSQEQTLNQGKH